MELERRLAKVARYHLALFVLPLLSLLYYGWWTASTLDQRPDNPLRLSPMALRGDIEDRNGKPLAHSEQEARVYPLGAAAGPLIGYHLRGRNQSGLEAVLQSSLSPPPPPKSLWGALSMDRQRREGHPPLKGPNVRLTIDEGLQKSLYEKFGGRAGVVVVADLTSGEILAAVSGPSFDPKDIARDWQQLRADPRSPLIERVGGGLYPVLFSDGADLLEGVPGAGHVWFGDNPFPEYPGASSAVDIDGVRLYSPLMLLQIAAQLQAGEATLTPRLLATPVEVATAKAMVPSGGTAEVDEGLQLVTLKGPRFRQSPPFQVLLGQRPGAERSLVFAIVVEGPTESEMRALRRDLLPVLRSW